MASKTRSIARNMAHCQMAADGIQHPNKALPRAQLDALQKNDKRRQWRDSRFATAWREFADRRVAACKPRPKKGART